MVPILRNNGQTGVLIHDHGDGRVEATALFNVGPKGAGSALLRDVVGSHGVNYVECLGAGLANYYSSLGFQVSSVEPFNPEKAVAGWDTTTMGTPDYYKMRLGK